MTIIEIRRNGNTAAEIESCAIGGRWYVAVTLLPSRSSISQGPYSSETAADIGANNLAQQVERDFNRRFQTSRHVVVYRDETDLKNEVS